MNPSENSRAAVSGASTTQRGADGAAMAREPLAGAQNAKNPARGCGPEINADFSRRAIPAGERMGVCDE